LNIILAIVCIGYIATLFTIIFPSMLMSTASSVASILLLCALPFELLNTDLQNNNKQANTRPFWLTENKLFSTFITYTSSTFGAVQYLVRNFNLVQNFTRTTTGVMFMRGLSSLSGILITGAKFSALGGLVGFIAHWLLAFRNWDELTHEPKLTPSDFYRHLTSAIWVCLFAWGIYNIGISVFFLPYVAALSMLAVTTHYIFHHLPWTILNDMWQFSASFTMPLGALLYTLVDFFNSYAIIEAMGWVSPLTVTGCVCFGVFSWINVILIWGNNFLEGKRSENSTKSVQLFQSLYDAHWSVRRVSSYFKEAMLLILDLFNNYLALDMINYVLGMVTGYSVGLFTVSICTIAYALNKAAVLYFQSSQTDEAIKYQKPYLQQTVCAKVCSYLVGHTEDELKHKLK